MKTEHAFIANHYQYSMSFRPILILLKKYEPNLFIFTCASWITYLNRCVLSVSLLRCFLWLRRPAGWNIWQKRPGKFGARKEAPPLCHRQPQTGNEQTSSPALSTLMDNFRLSSDVLFGNHSDVGYWLFFLILYRTLWKSLATCQNLVEKSRCGKEDGLFSEMENSSTINHR